MYVAVRLFEARTILEDLAVIARLKRLGVRGDAVFHRDDAETSRGEIEEVTSGGAIRLVALDSLETPTLKGAHRRVLRNHLRDLGQARNAFDLLVRGEVEGGDVPRGGVLGRVAKLVPEVLAGLELVKGFSVLNAVSAEEINEVVQKHRSLVADYGNVAGVIDSEADHLGARHRVLPLLVKTLAAILQLLDQHVLFCPKPLHGERSYQEWVDGVSAASLKVHEVKARLDRLSTTHVWAAG